MNEIIPEYIIDLTLAHEMIHYMHGFNSPLPKQFRHPHAGSVVDRELKKRGFGHLIYNGFALALFGSMLEKFIGGKRFLLVFFACGIVANIISINFYNSSLGASGAIYGIFGTLVLIRPFMLVWAFGLPMPMLVAGILWAGGDLIGLFIPSNVGHIAHLSGMLLGLILGAVFRKYYLNVNRRGQEGRDMHMDEISMRRWEEDYLK